MFKTEKRRIKPPTANEDVLPQVGFCQWWRRSLEVDLFCNVYFQIINEIAQDTSSGKEAIIGMTFLNRIWLC